MILTLIFSSFALGQNTSYETLKNYQKKRSVVMNVQKTLIQNILNKTTQSSGKLFLSKSLWRYDTNTPKQFHIIYDGKKILFCDPKTHIKHYLTPSKAPILSILFDHQAFNNNFKYHQTTQKGRSQIHSFIGLKPSSPQKISIKIEKDRILNIYILWKPPLGEEHYQFSSIRFNENLHKDLFKHSSVQCS